MNCEKGDLAVYIGKDVQDLGRIVRCIFIHPMSPSELPCWVVEPPFINRETGKEYPGVADKSLKPLRDGDGVDEVLRKVGHPLSESHRSITAPKRQVEHAR